MTEFEYRTAQVRANSFGEWKLRVFNTDIYHVAYRFRHPQDPFPGEELCALLVRLGWAPDRRALLAPVTSSLVQRQLTALRAGWKPSAMEDGVWTMPVYREKSADRLIAAGERQLT
jgi:hypothetical protein